MTRRHTSPIDAYFEGPPPGYALLLAGDWGVGKSYFWRKYASDLPIKKGFTPVTISAAGLQTYEDLERALFQASISGAGPAALLEAGTVIGRALLRLVKVDPNDIKLKAEATSGKTVICIDDVERFAGPFLTLFGFVINLIDGSEVHCVLIADEARANKLERYGEFKERIVGKTIQLTPDAKTFCGDVIRGFAEQRSRDVLLAHIEQISDLISASKITNLRTVRFLLTELDGLLRNMPAAVAPPVDMQKILSAVTFWAVAVAKDSSNVSIVARGFTTEDLGIALALNRENRSRKADRPESDLDRLVSLLDQLGFYEVAYSWPASPAFVDLVMDREVDFEALGADFGLIAPVAGGEAPDVLSRLQDYRNLPDEQVQKLIVEARNEFAGGEASNLARLFELYRTLYWLSKSGIFELEPEQWTQEALDAIGSLKSNVESIEGFKLEFWMEPYDDNEQKVIAICKEVALEADELSKKQAHRRAVEALLIGGEEQPDPVSDPIFVNEDPNAILGQLRSGGIETISRFRSFFSRRARVTNAPDYVGDDRDFAAKLSAAISGSVPDKRPMTVLNAELRDLTRLLDSFVNTVDTYQR